MILPLAITLVGAGEDEVQGRDPCGTLSGGREAIASTVPRTVSNVGPRKPFSPTSPSHDNLLTVVIK